MDERRRREFRDNENLNADERRALFEEVWRAWRPKLIVYLGSFAALSAEDAEELAYLVYGEGLSLAEAASTTGSPLGTVKWRLHRMRAFLRAGKEAIDARS